MTTFNLTDACFLDCIASSAIYGSGVASGGITGSGGKFYFEITINTDDHPQVSCACIGVASVSASNTVWPGALDNNAAVVNLSTSFGNRNNASIAGGNPTQLAIGGLGHVIGVAVDTIGNRLWAIDWLGSTEWTPVPGGPPPGGGYDISGISGNLHIVWGAAPHTVGAEDAITLNSAGPFFGSPPPGFIAWGPDDWDHETAGSLSQGGGSNVVTLALSVSGDAASAITSGDLMVETWVPHPAVFPAGSFVAAFAGAPLNQTSSIYYTPVDNSGFAGPPGNNGWWGATVSVKSTNSKARV